MAITDMIDEFRMYLKEDPEDEDPDVKVPLDRKIALLNRGIRAMFPRIYQRYTAVPQADSSDMAIDADTYDYVFEDIPGQGIISSVRVIRDDQARTLSTDDFEVLPDRWLILRISPAIAEAYDGSLLEVTAAIPITPIDIDEYDDLDDQEWTGPPETLGIPVYYAMSMASAIYLDDRLQYDQVSVAMQQGAATPSDIMTASTFWMDRFNIECDTQMMPFPASRM